MSDEGPPTGSWTVILADDDDDHAILIHTALVRAASSPIEVLRARNGVEAIRLVEESPPDLLLLDLNMPGRAGHEVLAHLKGDPDLRSVPVAVLTSSDRQEDMARSYGLGGNHFITKPPNPAELERRLRALMENLSELSAVHRGSAGLYATAVSTLDPVSLALRRLLPVLLLGGFLAVLLLWAWYVGVLS